MMLLRTFYCTVHVLRITGLNVSYEHLMTKGFKKVTREVKTLSKQKFHLYTIYFFVLNIFYIEKLESIWSLLTEASNIIYWQNEGSKGSWEQKRCLKKTNLIQKLEVIKLAWIEKCESILYLWIYWVDIFRILGLTYEAIWNVVPCCFSAKDLKLLILKRTKKVKKDSLRSLEKFPIRKKPFPENVFRSSESNTRKI